jgi:ABC-2 type transport system ATP-binding protein
MIRVENLQKSYGKVRALDGLSLEVERGTVYGFLGPNGAGKTTTMRILSGLARPDGGEAWISGEKVGRNAKSVRAFMGVLPEEPTFYAWMTAREYLRDFVGPLYGLGIKESSRQAQIVLEALGLVRAGDRRIGGFSRGMRQRLGLAQALVHKPKVLLLDEPVSALDPGGRKDVLDAIAALKSETTILLSTHILADVERICDTIGIVRAGRMVIEAPREELLLRYAIPLIEIEASTIELGWIKRAESLAGVSQISLDGGLVRVQAHDRELAQKALLSLLVSENVVLQRFELMQPSLEDIFLKLTRDGSEGIG